EGEKNVDGACKPECDSPMTWDSKKKKCMCPEDVEPTEKDGKKYCCNNNFAYNKGTSRYDGYDPDICDCPEGVPYENGVCCKNASLWAGYCSSLDANGQRPEGTGSGYCQPYCGDGCPEGSTLAQNGVNGCCQGAKYNARYGGDAHWHFASQNPKGCGGCVDGTYTTNEAGTEFACCSESGKDVVLGVGSLPGQTRVMREEVDSSLCCPSGTYSETTGKCCQRGDNGNLTGHAMSGELDEGCCSAAGGHINKGKCCGSPGYLVDYTIDYEHCNCFDDNPPLEFKWDENSEPEYVCCAGKGFAYDENGNAVPETDACECAAPYVDFGRKPGEHRMCCHEDYVAGYTDETGSHTVCCGTRESGWNYTIKGCCADKGGTYHKTDTGVPYCCNGSTNLTSNSISAICCAYQAQSGTADEACCADDIVNSGMLTAFEELYPAIDSMRQQCCENAGNTWTQREVAGEKDYICCSSGVENRVSWPLRCCTDTEHEETLTWDFYGTGTVCIRNGKKAYPVNYCADAGKVCCRYDCNDDEVYGKTSDGVRHICCAADAEPSEFVDAVDGMPRIRCCDPGYHASGFEKNGSSLSRCCAEGEEASYDVATDTSFCCAEGDVVSSYDDANNVKKARCCPQDKPTARGYVYYTEAIAYGGNVCCPQNTDNVDNYGTCCNTSDLVPAAQDYVSDGPATPLKLCCPNHTCSPTSKYDSFHPVGVDQVCACGCLSDDDCNQNLASGEWKKSCTSDFRCIKPQTFTIGEAEITIYDDARGTLSEEQVEKVMKDLPYPSGASGLKVLFEYRTQPLFSKRVGIAGFHSNKDKKRTIHVNSMLFAPEEKNINRFLETRGTILHEDGHAVDALNQAGTSNRIGLRGALADMLSEIKSHRIDSCTKLRDFFNRCYSDGVLDTSSDKCSKILNGMSEEKKFATVEYAGLDWNDPTTLAAELETEWFNSKENEWYAKNQYVQNAMMGSARYSSEGMITYLCTYLYAGFDGSEGSTGAFERYKDKEEILSEEYEIFNNKAHNEAEKLHISLSEMQANSDFWFVFDLSMNMGYVLDGMTTNASISKCLVDNDCTDAEEQLDCYSGSADCVRLEEGDIDAYIENNTREGTLEYTIP
ncbi:MAG: hypothetical protein II938_03120, partial [Alphaproteobacteria bacterium]|nr:hypothetical protein [Alphaproteobacteria bacterium]